MPPRTKSCATCRKKRIKCDATLPHCLTCIRFGRQCPGVADEPLFVDMTRFARHGMQKRKKKSSSSSAVGPITALEITSVWPQSIDRISQQAMVTEAFYARFLSYWTSEGDGKDIRNRMTWLHRLPHYSTDGTNDALTLAVQATASSYCAVETDNLALTRHARDLYGRAMQNHSRFLARSRAGKDEVTIHMISTSVLFSFFEAMQATNAEAYRSHVYGAAKMFEVTSPRQCAEGILCQIFFHIRTQMAFVQLTSGGKQTPVDIRKILYNALDYEELPIFQRLTTHLTTLADIYSALENGEGISDEEQAMDFGEYMTVKSCVDALWHEYTESASNKNEILSWHDPSTDTTRYRDAFTALTIAYFCAARILLAVIAPQFAASLVDFTDPHRSILQASLYLQTRQIGCAYLRIAAPLLLVALHAPKAKQRRIATGYFESWKTGSMRGISALALEPIYRRSAARARLNACSPSTNAGSVTSDEGVCMLLELGLS